MAEGKPKMSFYWCASCGGCEEAVVDLAEQILEVVEKVDIVLWPVALDFKMDNVEKMEDGSIDISFINGAIRLSEQEEMVKLLRDKSCLVVAFGSCAHMGGIPGLANFWNRKTIFERVYFEAPSVSNEGRALPLERFEEGSRSLHLPNFFNTVKCLDQVIDVDYYLPGCPPPPALIAEAFEAILAGTLPPKGSVLAPDKTICDTCPMKKDEKISVKEFKRIHQVSLDPEKCFLEQGILCLGPVTRSGCGERCIKVNMPCRGCFGPTDRVFDQGAKFLSALASVIESNDEAEIEKISASIADPAGTFYRFSLPSSLLRRKTWGVVSDAG